MKLMESPLFMADTIHSAVTFIVFKESMQITTEHLSGIFQPPVNMLLGCKLSKFHYYSLRFLGCIELDTLNAVEQKSQAFHLGIAALLGDGIYNLGELVHFIGIFLNQLFVKPFIILYSLLIQYWSH